MIENGQFARINIMIACKSHIKNEDISEKKEIFIYGFKHIETDKIDNYILFWCESYEINKIINYSTSGSINL